jgi:hypothetical protein
MVCIALWGYLNLFEMLDYYGAHQNIAYENPELKKTIYQLYWGMTQYSILSLICFGISIYLWKRK